MAITVSSVSGKPDNVSFRDLYKKVWLVKGTINPANLAAAAEDSGTFTVNGVADGDMVLAYDLGLGTEAERANINSEVYVSAANTLKLVLTNLHATTAQDLDATTFRAVVVRPNW